MISGMLHRAVKVGIVAALVTAANWGGVLTVAPAAGQLLGTGAFGEVELVSNLQLTTTPGQLGDIAMSPNGDRAFVANMGNADCSGAGIHIVDISDPADPTAAGFLPYDPGTRPSEGLQVFSTTTRFFSGDLLVASAEFCAGTSKGARGGVYVFDISNPLRPVKLSAGFGAVANPTKTVFAWDAGEQAYLAVIDATEPTALFIIDITNPRRPRLIADYDVKEHIDQPELLLSDSRLHDIVVKQIDGTFFMLLSHGDGGFVLLDVTDPADPKFVGDTEYPAQDPLLLEKTGIELSPDGTAYYAEFTADNRFIIGADNDLAPYRDMNGTQVFDGWGYVNLFDATTLQLLDTFAIPEAMDPAFADGFGQLSVNELATDPLDPSLVYLSYLAGGLRMLQIQCTNPNDTSTCDLFEVGGYLGTSGNDFTGIETFVHNGHTHIAVTDRNAGSLWIFTQ